MIALTLFWTIFLWTILWRVLGGWIWFGLVFTGVVLSVYLGWYDYLTLEWKERVRGQSEAIRKFKDCTEKQDAPWRDSGRRENSMIVMGSIFVVAAFAILAGAASGMASPRIALAAPLVYCIWLLTIQLSTRVMNDSDAEMRFIAESEDVNGVAHILRRLYGDGHGNTVLIRFRRNHWLAYVPILWLSALYLIR
jgi:hypothetical protein